MSKFTPNPSLPPLHSAPLSLPPPPRPNKRFVTKDHETSLLTLPLTSRRPLASNTSPPPPDRAHSRPNRSSRRLPRRRPASKKKINVDVYISLKVHLICNRKALRCLRLAARTDRYLTLSRTWALRSLGLIAGQLVSRPRRENARIRGFSLEGEVRLLSS